MKRILLLCLFLCLSFGLHSQTKLDSLIPVRGLSLAIPDKADIPRFAKFVREELSELQVNTLILRIDYRYQYTSHPELVEDDAISKADVQQIVEACKAFNIQIVPQINLLGHQSWHSSLSKLLQVYPQFDETPQIKLPQVYNWPNEDGLYCKSYCPLHPEVHTIVFDLVDELLDVFETDNFHAGMDEVFYIGDKSCPRCSGMDKAELFAGEVTKIRNHLALKNKKLWIWGDRLIDGKTTGIGMWEASMNNTHRAIDLIPKDVIICDWHYERADQTAAYFAVKGFSVITCPWRNKDVALKQLAQIIDYRAGATPLMKHRFQGVIQTIWTNTANFLDIYYGVKTNEDPNGDQVGTFKSLYKAIGKFSE